jgi:glycosyltransferase family protein
MRKLYLFGTGKSSEIIEKCLIKENIQILGYIDNNRLKHEKKCRGLSIYPPDMMYELSFDYIIIATLHYTNVQDQLEYLGVNPSRIISFFSEDYIGCKSYEDFIDLNSWRYYAMKHTFNFEIETLEKKMKSYMNNIEYELADKIMGEKYRFPTINSAEEAIKKIIEEGCSLSRFGDGEFELMAERVRPRFQNPNPLLAKRLLEVLDSNLEGHLTAIADNYRSLDKFEENAAMEIREYMTPFVRSYHMSLLNLNKTYYDAYLSRPYILYKDKGIADQKFQSLMKIWENRELTIIEGSKTRMGIGNNLLNNAKSVNRILAPSEDAFDKYDNILSEALKRDKGTLFLIALGPTATVLSYDLANLGYQAIDIGHLDLEYDWYLKNDIKRSNNKYKYINEIPNGDITEEIEDELYRSQIIAKVL